LKIKDVFRNLPHCLPKKTPTLNITVPLQMSPCVWAAEGIQASIAIIKEITRILPTYHNYRKQFQKLLKSTLENETSRHCNNLNRLQYSLQLWRFTLARFTSVSSPANEAADETSSSKNAANKTAKNFMVD
jgi:hypothetical protein